MLGPYTIPWLDAAHPRGLGKGTGARGTLRPHDSLPSLSTAPHEARRGWETGQTAVRLCQGRGTRCPAREFAKLLGARAFLCVWRHS